MKRLLHIIASPRGDDSRTLKISEAFLEGFKKKYPGCLIDELNVATEGLPPLSVKMVYGKYVLLGGKELTDKLKDAWNPIIRHIERFLLADSYLVSTPMWNFNIPYTFKQYIDIIVQPKYLFRYTAGGVEGLAKNKKMVIITSRGGDYSLESPDHSFDFQEPYLRVIFGFVGITDITFINLEGADILKPEALKTKIEELKKQAVKTADNF